MKHHAARLVHSPNIVAQTFTQHARERGRLRRDDMHIDVAMPERRRHLESDEAGTDDHRVVRSGSRRDDPTTVR